MRTLPPPQLEHRMLKLREMVGDDTGRPMTIQEYGIAHWECELTPYLDRQLLDEMKGRGRWHVLHIHHVAGRGKYAEVPENWISVREPIHDWGTDNSRPFFVMCAWKACVIDKRPGWDSWTACKSNYRLSALESDVWIEACQPWPVIDRMRVELLEGA